MEPEEKHHEFIGLPCNLESRSSDPSRSYKVHLSNIPLCISFEPECNSEGIMWHTTCIDVHVKWLNSNTMSQWFLSRPMDAFSLSKLFEVFQTEWKCEPCHAKIGFKVVLGDLQGVQITMIWVKEKLGFEGFKHKGKLGVDTCWYEALFCVDSRWCFVCTLEQIQSKEKVSWRLSTDFLWAL